MRAYLAFPVLAVSSLLACGQAERDAPSAAGGAPSVPGRWDGVFSAPEAGITTAECEALATEVAAELGTGWCTVVIRLSYEGLTPLGYTSFCRGTKSSISESMAREVASRDVSFPNTSTLAGEGMRLAGPRDAGDPTPWVFYTTPSDFGGVAIVSPSSDTTLFGASIVWDGSGEVVFPTRWRTEDVGLGCATAPREGNRAVSLALPLEAPVNALLETKAQTTVLTGIWRKWGGALDSSAVMLYSPTAGTFDREHAEYIVILQGHTAGG